MNFYLLLGENLILDPIDYLALQLMIFIYSEVYYLSLLLLIRVGIIYIFTSKVILKNYKQAGTNYVTQIVANRFVARSQVKPELYILQQRADQ